MTVSGASPSVRSGPPLLYYPSVFARRLRHYAERRLTGYTDRGPLPAAAEEILLEAAERGFGAGSHFPGVWARDLCFAARGLLALGLDESIRAATEAMVDAIDDTFYTDFRGGSGIATPVEGVDTFPALVVLLDEVGRLGARAGDVAALASLHREKFFDATDCAVTGAGSSWWDSAARPREAYNTAMLLAAVRRLEAAGVATTYTGRSGAIREGLRSRLWNGRYFDERRGSSVLACDANVVPLYFGLVDDERAARIADALAELRRPSG